ncbi:MAG: 50S ribosomal protein L11 methyltransferase [Gammaproteobacteria bacterium]|nr:50S ribosomal protein L11 methyltransferase [Gammaproteobacteria bacterium]
MPEADAGAGWVKARLEVPAPGVLAVEALLETLGAVAVSLEDARDQPLLEPDPGAMPLWAHVVVSGLFPADEQLPARLEAARRSWLAEWGYALPELLLEPLADADWTAAWLQHAQPLQFDERLRIAPAELAGATPFPGATVILAPGLAFGTGSHPTTRSCLARLAAVPPVAADVIDFGCGSGILALAALVLGARGVVGVDHDPQALSASADNAQRNGVGGRLRLVGGLADFGSDSDTDSATCDVLLANVLAGPLIELAQRLAARVRPGGRVILSGILADQVEAVRQAWPAVEFEVFLDEGWACLDGRKPT